jgi:hypothetical protein
MQLRTFKGLPLPLGQVQTGARQPLSFTLETSRKMRMELRMLNLRRHASSSMMLS